MITIIEDDGRMIDRAKRDFLPSKTKEREGGGEQRK